MEKGYKILGNYIRLVDERNKDLSVTKLLGVSISKKFIPSVYLQCAGSTAVYRQRLACSYSFQLPEGGRLCGGGYVAA